MSGYDFYGNTIINSTTAVLLGGGRHNKIHGNTFIANDKDIAFDDRGMTWQLNYCRYVMFLNAIIPLVGLFTSTTC
jgi:hypothetical protein